MIRLGNEEQLKALPNTIEAWVEPFAHIGISAALLQEAFPELPLPNLFELYQNAERHFIRFGGNITYCATWQLHCLTTELTLTEEEVAQLDQLRDNYRVNSLCYLAIVGSPQAMQSILKACPDLAHSTDCTGENLLHYAASSGSPQAIQSILEACPVLAKSTDGFGKNLLHYAASSGSPQAIQFVLEKFPNLAESTNYAGINLLHFAASSGSPQAIQYVLETCPDLANSTCHNGKNLLHYAASSGSPQAIQFVLEKCSDLVKSTDNNGETPLHHAAYSGSPQAIQSILEAYPDLAKSSDKIDRNFLHLAALSGSSQAIRFLLITYPKLAAKLWVKNQDGDTPDSYALKKKMSPSPRDIKRTLFSEITTDLLNQKSIPENLIDFLDAFHDEWQSFLIESNPEDLPQEITSLPKYVPEKLLPHIHHIQKLIDLKGFATQPLPLSEMCLETIITLAAPAEQQVISTMFSPHKSILLQTLQQLLNQWRICESKDAPNLSNQIARTIKVIIDNHLRAPINDTTRKLDSLIIRALRAIPEIAAFNPSNKVAEGMDISPENYQQHFDAIMSQLDSTLLNEDTRRITTETLLPGIQKLITEQDKIIQHVIDHYGQLYYLSENLPLHTDHADHDKPEEYRATLNRILVDFFGMFYTCQKAGRLPDLFSKLSSGYCLEGRIRDTLEWTASLSDLKDFHSFMAEVIADYEAYQTIMLGKTNEEITQLQPALDFIMERFKDLPCKPNHANAPDGIIQEENVRKYLIDILGYADIPDTQPESNPQENPDSGCVIS